MKKQIVSETKQYQPSFPDALLLDDAPKVNSLNAITSDAVARAVAGASGEVPQVTESDNGKVLTAVYDEGGPAVEWGEATVDQNYDATSTNAQSGVAVAQALAEIPAPEEEVSVLSYGVANTEVTFLKRPNVKMVIASPEVNQTGLTALTYDSGVGTSINQNTTFLMFKLDGKPQYLTGNSGGELVISEDLAFPVTSQGAWGNMFVFPVIPSNPRYGDMAINIQGSPIVGGVIKAGTYTLGTSTAHPSLSSDYSDLAVLIQVGGSSQSVIDTAQQFLIDNASKFSIKWRGETYRATFPSANKLVPAYSSADAGKVLQVQNDGTLAWVTLS